MGSAQSKERRRQLAYPRQWQPWTRYEEFAQALLADPFRGPTPKDVRHINECESWEFEPPIDSSKPPLLVLAKNNEEWFRCLVEKCDPTVTWKGADGQMKGLGPLLMGNGTTNYAVWSTKLDEWKRTNRGLNTPGPGPPPTSSAPWGRQKFWTEFGNVAMALGITTVAVGGAALGFPAAALGPVIWMVIKNWHTSFSNGIGSTGLGAQELQELQSRFDGCVNLLGRVIVLLGTQIEDIDANPLDAHATERRAELQTRVDTLQYFLEDDIVEMARVGRNRASQQEKKRVMMAKLRSLFELCTSQEVLVTNRQILDSMTSRPQLGSDTMARAQSFPPSAVSSGLAGAFGTPGPTAGGGTAPLTASARAGGPSFTFDVSL